MSRLELKKLAKENKKRSKNRAYRLLCCLWCKSKKNTTEFNDNSDISNDGDLDGDYDNYHNNEKVIDNIEKKFFSYDNGIRTISLLFTIITFGSCIGLVFLTDVIAFSSSNMLAPYHLLTGLLAGVNIIPEYNTNTKLMATRVVTGTCVFFFLLTYLVIQFNTLLFTCNDPYSIATNVVIAHICNNEYSYLVVSIILIGLMLISVVVQIILDLLLRSFVLKNKEFLKRD
jgi:hypothetical protein